MKNPFYTSPLPPCGLRAGRTSCHNRTVAIGLASHRKPDSLMMIMGRKQTVIEKPSTRLDKAIKHCATGRGKVLKTEADIRSYVRACCSKSK